MWNKKLLKVKRLYIILMYLFITVIAFICRSPLLLFLLSFLAVTIFIPLESLGVIGRLFVVLISSMSINMLVAFVFWAFKVPLPVWYFVAINYAIGLALTVFAIPEYPSKYFPKTEVISFTLSFIILILMFMQSFSSFRADELLKVANGSGVDNISHLNFIDSINKQKGYLYGNRGNNLPINSMLGSAANNYPQGYHINAWIFSETVRPFLNKYPETKVKLANFIAGSIINFTLLVFCFMFLSFRLIKFDGLKKSLGVLLIVLSAVIYVVIGMLFSMFTDGFLPQVMSTSLLLSMIMFLIFYSEETNSISHKYVFGLLASISTIGVGLSYFFLLPVALLSLISVLVTDFTFNNSKIKLSNKQFYSLVIISSLSAIHGILYILKHSITADKINDQGGVLTLDTLFILGLSVIALSYSWSVRRDRGLMSLAIALSISTIFSLSIYVFQIITQGNVSYYYYKSTICVFLFASIICVFILARIYNRSKSEHLVKMMTAVGILILAISISQGTFGRYLNGDIKKSFKAPELFQYAVAMTEDLVCSSKAASILSIRSDKIADGDFFFNRSLMTLNGRSDDTQEALSRWSTGNADINTSTKAITQILHDDKINSNKKWLILTRDDLIKNTVYNTLGYDRAVVVNVDGLSTNDVVSVCRNL